MKERSEHAEQKAVVAWAEAQSGAYPGLRLLFAVPNSARRNPRTAQYLKHEGMKSGVPDLWLPVARRGYNGLVIEMKRQSGGTVSKAQRGWLESLSDEGYLAVVCKGADAAIRVLLDYVRSRD